MGLVVSLLMITVGAVMRFAVTAHATGFNIGTVGMILMLVGVLGAVMSIVFWAGWGGFNRAGFNRGRVVVTSSAPTVVERTTRRETSL